MTPQTTLAPGAPWPTVVALVVAIAAANERRSTRLALQLKAKKSGYRPHTYQKVKP